MNRILIALSGWRGSGKDTSADYLVERHGFTKLSFAAKLKDMVSSLYGVPREDLDHPTRKEMPLVTLPVISSDRFSEAIHLMLQSELKHGFWTPRALCILEGSVKRSVYSNFWVRECSQVILQNPDRNYVISDMRYGSEADTLKILMPTIQMVRVNRFDGIETQDPSERDLDRYKFDYVITNKGEREALYAELDEIVGRTKPF